MLLGFVLLFAGFVRADVPANAQALKLPAIFGDHMVLQQKQSNLIWGWDTPGTKITVAFAGQTQSATAAGDGKWTVKLPTGPAWQYEVKWDGYRILAVKNGSRVELFSRRGASYRAPRYRNGAASPRSHAPGGCAGCHLATAGRSRRAACH